jgi:hypothetical protein
MKETELSPILEGVLRNIETAMAASDVENARKSVYELPQYKYRSYMYDRNDVMMDSCSDRRSVLLCQGNTVA